MARPNLPGDLRRRLQGHGFTLMEGSSGGSIGSTALLFTDGIVDISVFDDRGEQGVCVGVRGETTYEIRVWSGLLGIESQAPLSLDEQLAWALDHMADVRSAVQQDEGIDRKLREVNWMFVKDRLGLSPDADPDDPMTWRRS